MGRRKQSHVTVSEWRDWMRSAPLIYRLTRSFRESEHAFGDNVALNFRSAARDCFREGIQIIVSPAVHPDDFWRLDTVKLDRRCCSKVALTKASAVVLKILGSR